MNYVPRTCKEALENTEAQPAPSYPLTDHREVSAYVLLGAPGIGKTTSFKKEAEALPNAIYVTARDFINLEDYEKWQNKTLFIDGLDEVRAGASDPREPFDLIRKNLKNFEYPKFRLSCREADWFGAGDRENLSAVSSDGQVKVLHGFDNLKLTPKRAKRSRKIDPPGAGLW